MVSNWTIHGGKETSLHHVTPQGAEYAERNIYGTMGNLLSSYNQNKGYQDDPIRKRLTNAAAENIAHKNQHGTMCNILHTQNERDIREYRQPAPGVPRLKTSDAIDIQNKSLNGSMNEILTVSQPGSTTFEKKEGQRMPVRARTDAARYISEYGTVGTIGSLILNPNSTNISSEREKFAKQHRAATDASNVPPVERVRSNDAEDIATRGKHGTYGILHGNIEPPSNNPKLQTYSNKVKQSFTSSKSPPKPRTRNAVADRNMATGNIGKLGILLQGKPLAVDSTRDKYNEQVDRGLSAECTQPQPRVRPEATGIAAQHKGFIGNLIVDKPNKPKLGARAKTIDQINYSRMKRKEREGKKKLEVKPEKDLWKSNRYDGTQSRLKEWMEQTYGVPSRPSTAGSVRDKATNSEKKTTQPQRPRSARDTRDKENINDNRKTETIRKSASETNVRRNFIAENARKAKHTSQKIPPNKLQDRDYHKKKEEELLSYRRGTVPQYLQERVAQWKEEEKERIANLPDPTVPKGHVVMDAKEKEETLQILVKSREQLMEQLQNMPLRNDTLRLHNTKLQIESKLSEIDDAIKIFSRPRVFIKQD